MELRDSDYMKRVLQYISKNMSRGYTEDQLRILLIQQGYSRAAVERGLRMYNESKPKAVVKPKVESQVVTVKADPVPEKKPGFFARLFGFVKKKEENKVPVVGM